MSLNPSNLFVEPRTIQKGDLKYRSRCFSFGALPAIACAILNKVVSRDMVRTLRSEPNAGSIIQPEPASLRLFLRNSKALSQPDPSDTLMIDVPIVATKQRRDPAVAIAPIFTR